MDLARRTKSKKDRKIMTIPVRPAKTALNFIAKVQAELDINPHRLLVIFMEEYINNNPSLIPFIWHVDRTSGLSNCLVELQEAVKYQRVKNESEIKEELVNIEETFDLNGESLIDLIEDLWD